MIQICTCSSIKSFIFSVYNKQTMSSPITSILPPDSYETNDQFDYQKLIKVTLPLDNPNNQIQSIRLPNSDSSELGVSSIYRNRYTSNKELIDCLDVNLPTLLSHFIQTVKDHPDWNSLGTRIIHEDGVEDDFFTYDTYAGTNEKRLNFAVGLLNLINDDDYECVDDEDVKKYIVSIFTSNRPEWIITSLACQTLNLTTTSLYDTLGPHTSKFILNFTKSPILVTALNKIPQILKFQKELPHLKFIISIDPITFDSNNGLIQSCDHVGIKLLDFNQVLKLGQLHRSQDKTLKLPNPATNDSLLCISFTSGTTGNPKGVKCTQKMAVAAVTFADVHAERRSKNLDLTKDQLRTFSFLPLAHIYELQTAFSSLSQANSIAYPNDPSPFKLLENLKIVKPHYVCLVPRVYSKFESAIKNSLGNSIIGSKMIKNLINYKINKNLSKFDCNQIINNSELNYLDSVITSKLRKALGFDNVEICFCGSAPISSETVNFLRCALNIGFTQGYGLTESFSGICSQQAFDYVFSSGPIGVTTEARLKSLPQMNYFTHDSKNADVELETPKGELLLRGPQIFKGYFLNKKATDEVLDKDGWFSTGDVASIDPSGRINIIDRVKNFFKLSQGEYVTPERIENLYLSCVPVLTQIFIYGDSYTNFLVGILGIDTILLRSLLKALKIYTKDIHLLNDDELLNKINDDITTKKKILIHFNRLIEDEGLQGFEKVHNFKLQIEL